LVSFSPSGIAWFPSVLQALLGFLQSFRQSVNNEQKVVVLKVNTRNIT